MPVWCWAVVWIPDKLGRVQHSGDDKLIPGVGMVDVLGVNQLLEVDIPLDNGIPSGTPDQIIEASRDENSHWPRLLLVVHDEGIGEVSDGATRDSYPIDMDGVRWTDDSGIPRMVDIVQLAGTKTHIKAIVWPDVVHNHAGGAHVGGVGGGVLHSLHDPDLLG